MYSPPKPSNPPPKDRIPSKLLNQPNQEQIKANQLNQSNQEELTSHGVVQIGDGRVMQVFETPSGGYIYEPVAPAPGEELKKVPTPEEAGVLALDARATKRS